MLWCASQALTSSNESEGGLTSSSSCSLEWNARYLKFSSGTREQSRERRSGEENMPWMLLVADLREGVNHGALLVRLEYNVDINSGASGSVTQSLPVGWNGMPGHQVCLTCISSQGTIGVTNAARGTGVRNKSAESQMSRVSKGGELRMCGLGARDTERHRIAEFQAGMQSFYCAIHFLIGIKNPPYIPEHRPYIEIGLELNSPTFLTSYHHQIL